MSQIRHSLQLAASALLALATAASAQEVPPRQVGVIEMTVQSVPRIVTLPGRAVSGSEAVIRPRVGGIITDILYQPGTALEQGDPMFRIDATTYEANLSAAEAQVASATAAVTQAEAAHRRTQQLMGSGSTQAQVEAALATLDQARASLQSADASRRLAQAELDWTTVRSPIDGMASVANVSVGDLVTAGQVEGLATVTRLDPIEVDMYEPSARMLAVIDEATEGRLQMNDKLQATLTLETGQTYEVTGELVAPGFSVSTSTGAVDTRFRFDNPRNLILPGMFVRGQVDMGRLRAFLVSQSATSRDRTGKLTAWVIRDGKAQQRELTDSGTWRHHWIVTDGLVEGDLLAVDGLSGLTEGAEVVPVPVTFDESGVVRGLPPADAENETVPAGTSATE